MSGNNLKHKTIAGAFWEGLHSGGAALLAFVSTIVLARLLTPEDYGYVGMIAIFIAVAETLINGGFGSALIQKKDPTDADYSTVFYVNIGVSVLLYLILFFIAPLVGRFYHMPMLALVLRVQGIVIVTNAFKIVQFNILQKRLQFKTIAIVELSVALVALALVIYLAWSGLGVWSLVIWRLFISVVTSILYWIMGHWKPRLMFSFASLKELFGFGGYMLLSSIVNQIYANVQGLLIGRKFSAETMGYYSKAQNAESLASSLVSKISNNVSFPVLAELQYNREAMVGMLRRITKILFFVTLPAMMILFLIAEPLFIMLYSERWLSSVPYFRILCFMGIFMCVEGVGNNAIAALGKGKNFFWQNLLKRIAGVSIMIVGILVYGMKGLLVGMVISASFNYIVNMFLISRHVGYSVPLQIRDVVPIIILTAISFFLCYVLGVIWNPNMYLLAILQIVIFFIVYIVGARLFEIDSWVFVKNSIQSLLKRIRKR